MDVHRTISLHHIGIPTDTGARRRSVFEGGGLEGQIRLLA